MPQIILGVGGANFRSSFKGHVSGPTKSLTRHLAQHFPVVSLDEYCTSKRCFQCTKEMTHPEASAVRNGLQLSTQEIQKQTTNPTLSLMDKKAAHVASRIYRCPTVTCCRECNRDKNAAMNIHLLLKHWLQNRPRPSYLTRQDDNQASSSSSGVLQLATTK